MNALVRQMAALSVLWSVCEMLLPEGKSRQLVRMTASLLVMTALLTTVSGWLGSAPEARPAMTGIVQQAAEQSYRRTALTAAANQLRACCERLAGRAGYQADASVYLTMEGAVDHVQLVLQSTEHPLMSADELAHALAGRLGVEKEQIRLAVEGS